MIIRSQLYLILSCAIFGCLIPFAAKAQIAADGTTSTTVNQNGNDFNINQGDRVGDNLFHSFSEFSVPTLGSAAFNNAADIANVFSRVTGNSISSIDGLLSANGAAKLFLINPNGIIFGENASLDLGGSFFASTADSLLFEGDVEFSAVNPTAPSLLEVSIPIGARFRDNPGEIVNRSFFGLEAAPGENLTLAGGNISFEAAQATASSGNIELGGLSTAGTVGINDDGSLSFTEDVIKADISLSNLTEVNVEGIGGGSIIINAGNLNLEDSLIFAGIAAESTDSAAQAGDIIINVTDNIIIDDFTSVLNQVAPEAVGDAGNIAINGKNLSLTNLSAVDTNTSGNGNAGSVSINAKDSITIDSSDIGSLVDIGAVGNAGDVNLNTGILFLRNLGLVDTSTFGQGNAGSVNITASDRITIDRAEILSEVSSRAVGDAGNVNINTGNLSLINGGSILTDTFGQGNGGLVSITAKDHITIDNLAAVNSQASFQAVGDAGDVSITTKTLSVTNGSFVVTDTSGQGNAGSVIITASDHITIDRAEVGSSIFFGEGDPGDVNINTSSLSLTNRGRVSASTLGEGNGGSVVINASDYITIDNATVGSEVSSRAVGDAGDVTINTRTLSLTNGSLVDTSTSAEGNAGSVIITASDHITIDDAEISSSVFLEAVGDAGGVTITADSLNITNGGQISASTSGNGTAGNVFIKSNSLELIGTSINSEDPSSISAFSNNTNTAGDLTIETGDLTIADDASVSVSNRFGLAGNLNITANSLSQNRGTISAEIGRSEGDLGANINFEISELWRIENESLVSATASEDADGGNININTDLNNTDLLLIAFPPTGANGSDIIANAEEGIGGRIDITAAGVFGIEFREEQTPSNDFTVSSEFGQSGETIINRTVQDPTSGLIELPQAVGDASDQISQNPCQQGVGSEFIITGRGGFPPNPNETLNSNTVRVGLVEPVPSQDQTVDMNAIRPNPSTIPEAIPAMGWVFNDQGKVTLTAYATTNTKIKRSRQQHNSTCSSGIAP